MGVNGTVPSMESRCSSTQPDLSTPPTALKVARVADNQQAPVQVVVDGHEQVVTLKDVHALQTIVIPNPHAEWCTSRVSNASVQISSIASVFNKILMILSWCLSGPAGAECTG